MQLYIHKQFPGEQMDARGDALEGLLRRVAEGTDTADLVVALYLLPGQSATRGAAYVRRWITPARFLPTHGRWKPVRAFGTPSDLPPQFKLIRLRLNDAPSAYPKKETDIYGWQFHYPDFQTHLAHLFAHELHHFRRHHLGLHPREGEHSANRWALDRVRTLGFSLEYLRIRKRRIRTRKRPLFKRMGGDPFASFRELKGGNTVCIVTDPGGRYTGQTAQVIRPIRANSKRMVIRTADGKEWRWPMNWLDPSRCASKH